jgi:hypothetical protein
MCVSFSFDGGLVFWFVVYCFLQCGELCVEEELVRFMTPVIEKTAFKKMI